MTPAKQAGLVYAFEILEKSGHGSDNELIKTLLSNAFQSGALWHAKESVNAAAHLVMHDPDKLVASARRAS